MRVRAFQHFSMSSNLEYMVRSYVFWFLYFVSSVCTLGVPLANVGVPFSGDVSHWLPPRMVRPLRPRERYGALRGRPEGVPLAFP